MKNKNKGFSLIELIIVIAIMAILVGLTTPVLIRFLGKSKVSADIQLCSTIQDAIYVSMQDPIVLNAEDDSKDQIDLICSGSKVDLESFSDSEFVRNVNEIVGYDVFSVSDNREHFRTRVAIENGEVCTQLYQGNYYVWIDGSDSSGRDREVVTISNATELDEGVIYAY